jgi:hypothetical protein
MSEVDWVTLGLVALGGAAVLAGMMLWARWERRGPRRLPDSRDHDL